MKSIPYIILFSFISLPIFLSCEREKELEPTSPLVSNDTIRKDSTVIKEDSIALLKSSTGGPFDDGKVYTFSYEYNSKNQVTKVSEFEGGGKFIQNAYEFQYSGDKIVTSKNNLNSSGTEFTYTYTGDLITKVTLTSGIERTFIYDINKNLILFISNYGDGKDSIIYEGYINNRPAQSSQYKISKEGAITNSVKRKYTYDADNNLIKEEFMDSNVTSWQVSDEYFYDLKIFNFNPKMPFGNEKGIEGGIYGNPNPDSKDVDTHISNKEWHYSYCYDPLTSKYKSTKTSIHNFVPTKINPKGLPVEMQTQSEFYNCIIGTLSKSMTITTTIEYIYVKK